MNRYKKFLRSRGFKLEDDFDFLPFNGIETVKVEISQNGLLYKQYVSFFGWNEILVPKYSEVCNG